MVQNLVMIFSCAVGFLLDVDEIFKILKFSTNLCMLEDCNTLFVSKKPVGNIDIRTSTRKKHIYSYICR